MIPKKHAPDVIRGGYRVSDQIMRQRMIPKSGHRFSGKIMRQKV